MNFEQAITQILILSVKQTGLYRVTVNSTGGYTAQKKRIELETENWWTEVFFGVALVCKLSFLKVIWWNVMKMYEKKN